jgi:hypothetical protein
MASDADSESDRVDSEFDERELTHESRFVF